MRFKFRLLLLFLLLIPLLIIFKEVKAQYQSCPTCPARPTVTITSGCDSVTKTPKMDVSWTPYPDTNVINYELWRTDNTQRTTPDGLYGYYYNNKDLSGLYTLKRKDPTIDSNTWTGGSPDPSINTTNFSIRWTGHVLIPQDGKYIFYVSVNDGMRFYFDGRRVLNQWKNQTQTQVFEYRTKDLKANEKYQISLEYYQNTDPSEIKLKWTGPGISTPVIVPSTQLFTNPLNYTQLPTQTTNTYTDSTGLVSNTDYSYLVVANGSGGSSAGLSQKTAAKNCSAPIISFNAFLKTCYTPTTWLNEPPPPIIKVSVVDDSTGVGGVNFILTDLTNSPNTQTTYSASNNPTGSGNWEHNFNPAPPAFVTGHSFRLEATGTDLDTPPNTSTPYLIGEFNYSTSCSLPWFQTTFGDVHSNNLIYTPGGP